MAEDVSYETNSYSYSYTFDASTGGYCGIYDVLENYNPQQIREIIKDPMTNNTELRRISRTLYSSNGLVRNTEDYMTSMATLDYVITSYSKDKKTKIAKEVFRYVLDVIKHKEFIRDALLKGMIDGTAIYYFNVGKKPKDKISFLSRWEADSVLEINSVKSEISRINAAVISLPVDYCRIVGLKNNHYVVAFDLGYFNQGSENTESKLRKYPKEIREAYTKWHNGESKKQMFILDDTKTIVHKISSNKDEPWGRPLVLAAILDILYSDYFTNTKRNILDNLNNQIIYQTFPQGREVGTSSLTEKQQERQHNNIKQAIQNKNTRGSISFFSVAAGTEINSLDVNTDLFDDDIESNLDTKIGTALGFAASLLSASGTTSFSAQQTNLELVTSEIFQWVEAISAELNKVINYNILENDYIDIKVNYLPITHINKSQMIGYAKDLYLMGKGSLLFWASAVGIPEDVFVSMVEHELEEDYENRFPVHRTSYTQSGDDMSDNQGGRPTVEETGKQVTNENTIRSRSNNANGTVKPSTQR